MEIIIFGALLMTPTGFAAGLSHMLFHAIMKITLFYCAGAVLCKTERCWVNELYGLGHKMKVTFAVYTIGALAIVGVPSLAGFVSKWNLATAAVESQNGFVYFGVGALLVSALLTAIYMLQVVVRAYFPEKNFDYSTVEKFSDPGWKMLVPFGIFIVCMFVFGLYSGPVVNLLSDENGYSLAAYWNDVDRNYEHSNNYDDSTIRACLNGTFSETS